MTVNLYAGTNALNRRKAKLPPRSYLVTLALTDQPELGEAYLTDEELLDNITRIHNLDAGVSVTIATCNIVSVESHK